MKITRRLEFDAGHRIPNHASQCRHLHGHRYALEVTLEGQLVADSGAADEGMVLDFADVKRIANELIVSRWDHAFLAFEGDAHVEWFEGNFEAYEQDKVRRLGPDSIEPKRVKYKRFSR